MIQRGMAGRISSRRRWSSLTPPGYRRPHGCAGQNSGGYVKRMHDLYQVRLDLQPNEASGLLTLRNPALLDRRGWDRAFWTVLDEVDVARALGVLGHRRSDPPECGWEVIRLEVRRSGDERDCEDAESITRVGDEVWVLGSQHGGKDGPIRKRNAWVARFFEREVAGVDGEPVELEVRRIEFALHRAVNDALRAQKLPVTRLRSAGRAAFIDKTLEKGRKKGDYRPHILRGDDVTVNVEGAAFREGRLLLGLRFPVAADGRPLVAVVSEPQRLFAGEVPQVVGFWVLDAIGRGGALAGVRDLSLEGDQLHVITGNLDSRRKDSVILSDYPEGRETVNTHFVCTLPPGASGGQLQCEVVREFPDLPRIEGIAAHAEGNFHYVSDEDEGVILRMTRLISTS